VYDQAHSRKGLNVEQFRIRLLSAGSEALIVGRIRFWDDSLLHFREELVERSVATVKTDYAYHYQTADGALLFRYDNSPHYPEIETFPHHKHVGTGASELITPARPPDLIAVLREIETMLAARQES
jgi:hypothetical protein